MMLGGCKVLTIEEDRALRARRTGGLDAGSYVSSVWSTKVVPTLRSKALPMDKLVVAVDAGLGRAGARFGRQVGEGSAWTFVVTGTGTVTRVDTVSRRGTAEIAWSAEEKDRPALLQIGPVVADTAIRDALPFVTFNDFADQLVFADVGRKLTARALTDLQPAIRGLHPGQRVQFLGVVNLRTGDAPFVVTPVSIAFVDPD
jgi:predicted lipoprotein